MICMFAVMRFQKHTTHGNIGGASSHCERERYTKNVDSTKTMYNEVHNYRLGDKNNTLLEVVKEQSH